ncbi:MAG: hypothetical protein KDI50_09385, partial [Candidatus Competibacteraceae bacterium]|nr:hypothetical protein [Candidatus Competibacteraceae bacterium]
MTVEEMKARLQAELPELLKQDHDFRQWLEQLIRQTAVTPETFDARFEKMLQELAADRAERRREWEEWGARFDARTEEQNRKWDEQNHKWDEQNRKWDEQNRKWDEQKRELKEWGARFDAHVEEQNRKWDEQKREQKEWGARFDAHVEEQNHKWDEQKREQ